MRKNKFVLISLVAVLVVFSATGFAFAWGSQGGDGSRFDALQEKSVFFNNSGSTLTSGSVVILDRTGTGVTRDTTLGAYITTTTTADSIDVVGVTSSTSCLDQTPCVVVTKGPALTLCQDSTDAVSTGASVGTTATAGRCGGAADNAAILGEALEAGQTGGDTSVIYIWVDPERQ